MTLRPYSVPLLNDGPASLAESERNLKKRLQQKELEVEEAGKRRLEDLSEALRKQQNLRSKVEEDQEVLVRNRNYYRQYYCSSVGLSFFVWFITP